MALSFNALTASAYSMISGSFNTSTSNSACLVHCFRASGLWLAETTSTEVYGARRHAYGRTWAPLSPGARWGAVYLEGSFRQSMGLRRLRLRRRSSTPANVGFLNDLWEYTRRCQLGFRVGQRL